MWVNFTSRVAFIALLVAYAASLAVGWSYAEAVPFVAPQAQRSVLTAAAAVALVAWPVWLLHWRWARNDWLWDSAAAQHYLAFFTVVGLGASVVVGVQLIARVLNVLIGSAGSWADNRAFLFGAGWSVVFSLWVWAFHGLTWLRYRRHKTTAAVAVRG
jgi:hypothetical protein